MPLDLSISPERQTCGTLRNLHFPMQARIITAGCLAVLGLALTASRSPAQPALDWFLIDGIVGVSGNGSIEMVGTISHADAVFMSHGALSIHSMFDPWPGFPPSVDPPILQISLTTNHVVFRWPAFFSAYQLECAPTLESAGTNWTTVAQPPVTEGAELHLTLPANAPARFYRLRRD